MISKYAQYLPKRAKIVWVLDDLIGMLVLGLALLILNLCLGAQWPSTIIMVLNIMLIVIIGLVIGHLLLIPYYYRFHRYALDDTAILIYKGFFLRKTEAIPLNRIQNVDTTQGPLLQFFHLKRLVIVTAAHSFSIAAVDEQVAQTLRERLILAARQAREVNNDD
ncbi:PH domain-containing protein [Leuconostoc citreum]|uniref:Membrane protein n=1 Tax=Leuconostoc citreum (strain KM20) TaxID=349519 RepID=B1MZU7_LEUCK|nr:PH domain-containing protein [Leuconostoc citreum]ACA83049.1 Putative membrane protein [Leuconostoc citreum KM20]MCJ2166602.1 PH domain-containing protein [Leuconostoc citreum]MCT3077640.1 hypothetical protein [Leuconostoc citreum]MDY5161999.1 PH domain-containing protein [Leuconostoc citreum]MDY5165523.1 PH domain-containing protein [Leuconostoc citreum]